MVVVGLHFGRGRGEQRRDAFSQVLADFGSERLRSGVVPDERLLLQLLSEAEHLAHLVELVEPPWHQRRLAGTFFARRT
jgi:hypothetical protein